MKITPTKLPEVLLIEPKVFADARGFFFESYIQREFQRQPGLDPHFVQDNHSRSAHNVLRGLHYQVQQAQGKLVRVLAGEIYDVAVDIRRNSPTLGQWTAHRLSGENRHMMWIPADYAHGFLVTSDFAEVEYKTTDYWAPQHERCILWNDVQINIPWPLDGAPLLSDKDRQGKALADEERPN